MVAPLSFKNQWQLDFWCHRHLCRWRQGDFSSFILHDKWLNTKWCDNCGTMCKKLYSFNPVYPLYFQQIFACPTVTLLPIRHTQLSHTTFSATLSQEVCCSGLRLFLCYCVDIHKIFRLNTEYRTSKCGENVSFRKHIAVPCPLFENKLGLHL